MTIAYVAALGRVAMRAAMTHVGAMLPQSMGKGCYRRESESFVHDIDFLLFQ